MCGILGSHNFLIDHQPLLDQIHHRGPDESIIKNFPKLNFAMGMTRLAIRDLQPHLYPFTYLHYSLVYNGEIYNLSSLKKLIPNYHFKTNCDAEVILPLYAKFGPKCFDFLTGMFAIAILDTHQQELTLVRDKFGEKPIYYYHTHHQFFFASEVSAFPAPIKQVNLTAIPEYLTFGFVSTSQTFYQHIFKLQAGQYLHYSLSTSKIKINNYYHHQPINPFTTTSSATISLESDLQNIIQEKTVADVPTGLFLSGGLDSSLLAAINSSQSVQPIDTFSIGFKSKTDDELIFAQKVAKHLHTRHHHYYFRHSDLKTSWQEIFSHLDEPISDPAIFPTFFLSKQVAKSIKVVLSGEGADEIFSGYTPYIFETQTRSLKFLPFPPPNYRLWRLLTPISHHYTQTMYHSLWFKNRPLYFKLIRHSWQNQPSSLLPDSLQLYDLNHYLPNQLCMKLDKMTMSHSLESRAPYLDVRLLKYLPLSGEILRQTNVPKYLLKQVAAKYLPQSIISRPKHGFSLPLHQWLPPLVPSLDNPHPILLEFLSHTTIKTLQRQFLATHCFELTLWNLVSLNTWLKLHF